MANMDLYGYTCKCLGTPVDPDGSKWIPMDPNNPRWMSINILFEIKWKWKTFISPKGNLWIWICDDGSREVMMHPMDPDLMDLNGSWWIPMDPDGSWWIRIDLDGSWWILVDLDGSWCHEGIWTCYRRAIIVGTPEFPCQLFALLLVAHWLERWCASLVAQVPFRACLIQSQLFRGETQ